MMDIQVMTFLNYNTVSYTKITNAGFYKIASFFYTQVLMAKNFKTKMHFHKKIL